MNRSKHTGNQGRAHSRRLELTLESNVESAGLAESLVAGFAQAAGFNELECQQIGLAIREAVANAALHGNRCDENKTVSLTADLQPSCLGVSVRDEGEGFKLDEVKDPLNNDNLLRDSGRGIFLVRACMNDFTVRRLEPCGTEIFMMKHFSKEAQNMNLTTSSRQVDGVTVVDVTGRIVLGEESSTLRESLKSLAANGQKKVLLNLAGVTYIDSSGLGALVSGFTTITGQQGQMKLVNLTNKVHDLLQITKLLTVFEVYTDEATAIASFR
ncbi:MAG: anti-sigma factor antagonist [Acidobacteria bacterium]|nr:anti-sigma factor antagonist [Acidobacteriota bacterium]